MLCNFLIFEFWIYNVHHIKEGVGEDGSRRIDVGSVFCTVCGESFDGKKRMPCEHIVNMVFFKPKEETDERTKA